MNIVSHRGNWVSPEDKNTLQSLVRSLDGGYGLETDLRDQNGEIVISHDPPTGTNLKFSDFLIRYIEHSELVLALNIKSDGLCNSLKSILSEVKISNYFVFDMSIPDMISYKNAGINFFSRQSELENEIVFYNESKGVWLDSFEEIWFSQDLILNHLNNKKSVMIVSPELHKRNHLEFWGELKTWDIVGSNELFLCTDFPDEAKIFFNNI
jgi:glycerophosphoryl diester phosphodiesterase